MNRQHIDALEAAANTIDELKRQLESGSAELRRSVEANGFQWQEGESAVWHAVTAIGFFRGEIEELKRQLDAAREREKRLRQILESIEVHSG